MLDTIFFDLDDTLLDFRRAERNALCQTLAHLRIEPREDILRLYSQINLAQWKRLEQGEITRDEVKVGRYRLLFEKIGVDRSAREATQVYESRLSEGHDFIDGASELLATLQADYRLYLVSSGTAAVQEKRLKDAGIIPYFQNIFISQQIGFNKPDVRFFQRCFEQIPNFCKERAVIVGDSLSSDIQGGKNAGIRTIWFCSSGPKSPGEPVPDHVIRRLDELPPLLSSL